MTSSVMSRAAKPRRLAEAAIESATPALSISWALPHSPQIRKKPGDFWIDFPLRAREKEFGKLSLQCDENLRPENFELLKRMVSENG